MLRFEFHKDRFGLCEWRVQWAGHIQGGDTGSGRSEKYSRLGVGEDGAGNAERTPGLGSHNRATPFVGLGSLCCRWDRLCTYWSRHVCETVKTRCWVDAGERNLEHGGDRLSLGPNVIKADAYGPVGNRCEVRTLGIPEGHNGTAKTEAITRDTVENNYLLGKKIRNQFKRLSHGREIEEAAIWAESLFIRSKHYITNDSNVWINEWL